ncbi:metallophosphoesterase [Aquabacterium sp.]|uniref:metallophosphoesterase family protein n=1 Tax=Aquabacterium sp. TaxID=1872578 RepID=UPI0035AED762
MKIALLSDLHANRQATESVWAHAQSEGVDQLVLLGDYVDYGADPAWVIDFVRDQVAHGAIAVKGNHDDAVVADEDNPDMAGHVLPSLKWTRQQLSADQKAFLAGLPLTATVGPCLVAHANAHDPANWGYIMGRLEATRSLFASDHQFVFCGHMHDPALYHLTLTGKGGNFTPVQDVPIELSSARRWLAIPGSVGQPRDGNPAACYAMFDTDTSTLTFHRVPYDHDAAAQRIRDAGLPPQQAERLLHGR